ncbi:MAG: ABC transporter ATP-binding protein [Candidatus Aenigmatarchaeota archaeon]
MKSVIKFDNVSKIYQLDSVKVEALKHVNIEIKEKEFISIMGASGSGKSTLLNLIGVLDKPTEGSIYLDSVDISKLSGEKLARIRGRQIGFVFQFFNLYPTLTAKENVELPMIIYEVEKKRREKRVDELLDKVDLGERAEHYPAQLSGGERQRVAIARALANNPSMILADEPTGNLDSKTGVEIMEVFAQLNNEGKTIVMVTHEKNIAQYSKRIIHVKDGKIMRDGSIDE